MHCFTLIHALKIKFIIKIIKKGSHFHLGYNLEDRLIEDSIEF